MTARTTRRSPLALTVVVLTIVLGLAATQAAAPAADIGSGKSGQGFHLTSPQNTEAAPFLEDPANFGPRGIVAVDSLNIVPDTPRITPAYLAGLDVLFDGWMWSDDWTAAEIAAINTWVRNGGILISTNDDGAAPQPHAGRADRLATRYGAPIRGSVEMAPDAAPVMTPAAGTANNPMVNGPFGRVRKIVSSGTTGHFGPNPAGFNVVFQNPAGNAVVIDKAVGKGHVILVGDEAFFHRFLDQSPFPTGDNRIFTGNVFAYALSLAGETVKAPTCFGRNITIVAQRGVTTFGTAGNDVILGTGGPDVINGRGGNDRICSRGGNDTVRGGAGIDRINAGPGRDKVVGGPGNDRILGSGGHDTLLGNGGADTLLGQAGRDTLRGGGGSDVIGGGPGVDRCVGGPGADSINGCE